MLTLTAPGTTEGHGRWVPEGLPDEVRRRLFADRAECSCHRSLGAGLGDWNASAGACWNRLRTALARLYPGIQFLRSAEVQKRGAIHYHVILATREPLELLAVQGKALEAGFGCTLDYAPITDARRAAYYVSKYVTKSVDSRDDVPWVAPVVDEQTGEIRRVRTAATFRAWSSSREWGLTMREIRDALAASARLRAAALVSGDELEPATAPPAGTAPASGTPPPAS